jgi:hypothetical protein
MVIKIGGKHTNKTQFLAINYYGTNQSPVVCDNFNPGMDPLLESLLSSSMRQAA